MKFLFIAPFYALCLAFPMIPDSELLEPLLSKAQELKPGAATSINRLGSSFTGSLELDVAGTSALDLEQHTTQTALLSELKELESAEAEATDNYHRIHQLYLNGDDAKAPEVRGKLVDSLQALDKMGDSQQKLKSFKDEHFPQNSLTKVPISREAAGPSNSHHVPIILGVDFDRSKKLKQLELAEENARREFNNLPGIDINTATPESLQIAIEKSGLDLQNPVVLKWKDAQTQLKEYNNLDAAILKAYQKYSKLHSELHDATNLFKANAQDQLKVSPEILKQKEKASKLALLDWMRLNEEQSDLIYGKTFHHL